MGTRRAWRLYYDRIKAGWTPGQTGAAAACRVTCKCLCRVGVSRCARSLRVAARARGPRPAHARLAHGVAGQCVAARVVAGCVRAWAMRDMDAFRWHGRKDGGLDEADRGVWCSWWRRGGWRGGGGADAGGEGHQGCGHRARGAGAARSSACSWGVHCHVLEIVILAIRVLSVEQVQHAASQRRAG
jgi:hypothetical protein